MLMLTCRSLEMRTSVTLAIADAAESRPLRRSGQMAFCSTCNASDRGRNQLHALHVCGAHAAACFTRDRVRFDELNGRNKTEGPHVKLDCAPPCHTETGCRFPAPAALTPAPPAAAPPTQIRRKYHGMKQQELRSASLQSTQCGCCKAEEYLTHHAHCLPRTLSAMLRSMGCSCKPVAGIQLSWER